VNREELKFEIWQSSIVRVVIYRSVFRAELCISPLEQGIKEGDNPVLYTIISALWYVLYESSCLGMQLKMGGKFHLKLNIGERPIANKYREGKMKSTLERELNSTWNCWKGNEIHESCLLDSAVLRCTSFKRVNISFVRWIKVVGRWLSRECYSLLLHTLDETEDCSLPLWPGFAHVQA
jgi:hypothetical protein